MLRWLKIKFICINMAMVTAMLLVIFGLVLHFTGESLAQESIRMMQAVGEGPIQPGPPDALPGEMRLPCFTLEYSPRGELVAIGGSYFDLSDQAMLQELMDLALAEEAPTGVLRERQLRFYRTAGPYGQRVVFADISGELAAMDHLRTNCLLIGGAGFLAFLLTSFLLAGWAVRPVERSWAQQRQFVSDASHELKTPLTVIMTNAELLQSPDYDATARARSADHILTMSRQMRGLVEGLLELARVDSGAVKTIFTQVDFSRLVSDALLPFEPVYFERGLTLEGDVQEGIPLRGSEAHLRQVVEILLDNAQKYAAPGAAVAVRLARQGRRCLLSVANPGEAISPEDLKNIFKRFYRADKARRRDGSYGLGLSIAAAVVADHRGRIWAESTGGVNTFYVSLPVAG